jgi:hypothetical protein
MKVSETIHRCKITITGTHNVKIHEYNLLQYECVDI